MTANSFESVPDTWDDERDGTFFRLVAALFDPHFLFGASVLLASYDETRAPGLVGAAG